jgi:hypothetical protein
MGHDPAGIAGLIRLYQLSVVGAFVSGNLEPGICVHLAHLLDRQCEYRFSPSGLFVMPADRGLDEATRSLDEGWPRKRPF